MGGTHASLPPSLFLFFFFFLFLLNTPTYGRVGAWAKEIMLPHKKIILNIIINSILFFFIILIHRAPPSCTRQGFTPKKALP
jgi:hypothetical protein